MQLESQGDDPTHPVAREGCELSVLVCETPPFSENGVVLLRKVGGPPKVASCADSFIWQWKDKAHKQHKVGVGMPSAEHPLHRSGRAALPQSAPTLGDDTQAHEGIGMTDVCRLLKWNGLRN